VRTVQINKSDKPMLLPRVRRVMTYVNGSNIYMSGVHPFIYDTQELQNLDIDVVISFMDETYRPDFMITNIPTRVKHYYYSIKDSSTQILKGFYDPVFNVLHNALEREKNVLIHCRSGESVCVAMLIAFMLQCVRWAEKYLIFDYLNYIPKVFSTWTDSFLYHISEMYPPTRLRYDFKEQLYEYERKILPRTDD
jgi:hypothetical protein